LLSIALIVSRVYFDFALDELGQAIGEQPMFGGKEWRGGDE